MGTRIPTFRRGELRRQLHSLMTDAAKLAVATKEIAHTIEFSDNPEDDDAMLCVNLVRHLDEMLHKCNRVETELER